MKTNLFYLASLCPLLGFSAFSQPLMKECWLENVPSTNQSIQQCAVFSIAAGADVTIQSSTDLVSWTEEISYYSLGGEFVFPMREFTAAPPPDPGAPSPSPTVPLEGNVSLLLQPASGTGGGSVASWPSLDGSGAVVVYLTESLHSSWASVPNFVNTYGGYLFMISHPPIPAAPPASAPMLGEKDAEILALLEEHLSSMNAAVAAAEVLARNSPPPAPSAPGAKKFFRAFKSFPDTDGDGILDINEFKLSAAGNPMGNAFNSDVDGDGIDDGKTADSDGDGTVDAEDVSPSDAADAAKIVEIPRYAFFEINKPAVQINDLGTVLMADSTWKAGETKPLAGTGPAWNDANAFAINDSDMILGHHLRELSYTTSNGNSGTDAISTYSFWLGRTSAIAHLVKIDSGITYYGGPSSVWGGDGPVLSEDGVVYGDRHSYQEIKGGWVQESPYFIINSQPATNTVWQLPTAGNSNVSWVTRPGSLYYETDGIQWGVELEGNKPRGVVYAPGKYKLLPSVPRRVFRDPNNRAQLIALDNSEAWTATPSEEWKKSEKYRYALDIAKDGTAIGINHPDPQKNPPGDFTAPIQINGKWQGIERTAPGLPARVTTNLQLADTTPKGWVLGSFHEGLSVPSAEDYHAGVMLPIRITGVPADQARQEITGVDEISVGATDPDAGDNDGTKPVSDRLWIMAPAGRGSTQVTVEVPLNSTTPLKLSAPGVLLNGAESVTLTSGVSVIAVKAADPNASGQTSLMKIEMGTAESLSQPIGIQIMKARTVKVTVHPIGSLVGMNPAPAPSPIPNKLALEQFLDEIYEPQMNVKFNVKIQPVRNFQWDTADGSEFEAGNPVTPGNGHLDWVQNKVLNEEKAINSLRDSTADINVYLLANAKLNQVLPRNQEGLVKYGAENRGYARREIQAIFLAADVARVDEALGQDPVEQQAAVLAHEIGHIMVGDGHPEKNHGVAPLKGLLPQNAVKDRMMIGGENASRPHRGSRFVRGEWHAAEKWLKQRPLGDH